ncbi:hypothetical protein OF83DRAFT_1180437 [Amylostereum chailletii]|nr:hypothetical protein OF83DRAFT_1180437 [Amylostereum chailletii]
MSARPSVVTSDAGKTVRVQGHVLCEGKLVIEIEPDYIVILASDADVSVLQSKEWTQWTDDTEPLLAGTAPIFPLKSAWTRSTAARSVSRATSSSAMRSKAH